jgi:hypothetical protein
MARTKEEIASVLAERKVHQFVKDSVWTDLTGAVQSQGAANRSKLLDLLKTGNVNEAGQLLRDWLADDAKTRAKVYVDNLLADNSLSIAELDELL